MVTLPPLSFPMIVKLVVVVCATPGFGKNLNCSPTTTCEVTTETPVKDVTVFDTVAEEI